MQLTLKRMYFKENYTIGKLYINGSFFSDTLEDKYRDLTIERKIDEQTAIPYGSYRVIMSYSNRFGRLMPELLNVPYFTAIRLHSGNTPENTEGCILVGKNDIVGGLSNSRYYSDALNVLIADALTREQVWIDIV